jgi:mannose-6-phosphate isomerase-like protein (cupin superfamily)
MQFHHGLDRFHGANAWDSTTIGTIDGVTVKVHWTDQPYTWHTNDGAEAFVVLAGTVDMHWRDAAGEHVTRLDAGDAYYAAAGDEHVAHPQGAARILVVERRGSV